MKRTLTTIGAAALVSSLLVVPAAKAKADVCEDEESCTAPMSVEQAARVAGRWICPALRAEERLDRYAVEGHRLSRKARAAAFRVTVALEDLSAELSGGWTEDGLWPNGESADTAGAIADMAGEDSEWLSDNVTRRYVWDGYELYDMSDDIAQLWADLGVAPVC